MTETRCVLCPRRCGALRTETEGRGVCGMGTLPVAARAALHTGEEPCISGARGSGTVFFLGCALRCAFCQNGAISGGGAERAVQGHVLSVEALSDVFRRLEDQGAHNINLVTADHFIPAVAEALRRFPPGVPVVLNTGGYLLPEAIDMLDGLVSVYLPDFKFADAETARLLAGAPDYPEVALAAIRRMREQTGPAVYDGEGMLVRGVLVRHLVLPGLSGMSMRALSLLRDALPGDVRISLMGQYTPLGRAPALGLDRPLLPREYARVKAQMRALGFDGFVQKRGASGVEMIPVWDGTGLGE